MAPLVIALGTVLTAFNEAGKLAAANWPLVAIVLVVGLVAFVLFWRVEDRAEHPLVSTTYMKQRRTWALPIAGRLAAIVLSAMVILPGLGAALQSQGVSSISGVLIGVSSSALRAHTSVWCWKLKRPRRRVGAKFLAVQA